MKLSKQMATVLSAVATSEQVTFDEYDLRTLRALERRGYIRYVRTRDTWKLTPLGKRIAEYER